MHILTKHTNCISNFKSSNGKANQLPNQMSLLDNIRKQITVLAIKFTCMVHRCIDRLSIRETSLRQKIKNVFPLRQKDALRRITNFNTGKIMKST